MTSLDLPSVDLKDLASRAHCRWAAGSWLARGFRNNREINVKLVLNFWISNILYHLQLSPQTEQAMYSSKSSLGSFSSSLPQNLCFDQLKKKGYDVLGKELHAVVAIRNFHRGTRCALTRSLPLFGDHRLCITRGLV